MQYIPRYEKASFDELKKATFRYVIYNTKQVVVGPLEFCGLARLVHRGGYSQQAKFGGNHRALTYKYACCQLLCPLDSPRTNVISAELLYAKIVQCCLSHSDSAKRLGRRVSRNGARLHVPRSLRAQRRNQRCHIQGRSNSKLLGDRVSLASRLL